MDKEAVKDSGGRKAMQNEIEALEKIGTWTMETLPHGKRAFGSRWVYKIKYNAYGTIERLKACLVMCRNHQVDGINYDDTFAPVAKMITVHTRSNEQVYMKLPPGFGGTQPNRVC